MELFYFINSTKDETSGEAIPAVIAVLAESSDDAATIFQSSLQDVPPSAEYGEVAQARAIDWKPAEQSTPVPPSPTRATEGPQASEIDTPSYQQPATDQAPPVPSRALSAWVLPLPRLDWKQRKENGPAPDVPETAADTTTESGGEARKTRSAKV